MASNICAELRAGIVTASAEETRVADITLALHGDLGVGKTTFVQGLARGFGIEMPVTSPTFAIYSVYPGGRRRLVHLDAYRIEREEQLDALLLDDFLLSPYCLAVEWPEKTGLWLAPDAWHLTLSITEGERHRLQLA